MSENQSKRSKTIKVIIIILSILLAVSATMLVGVKFVVPAITSFFAEETTVTVPNQIGSTVSEASSVTTPTDSEVSVDDANGVTSTASQSQSTSVTNSIPASAPVLEFYQGQPEHNRRFEVRNILPGDVMERYYCIRAHHSKDVTLVFRAEVTEQTKNLGDVLDVTILNKNTDSVLCEGSFNAIHNKEFYATLPANADNMTDNYYYVKVSVDTSVGNEYQQAGLLADLHWYIAEGSEGLEPPPQTGDDSHVWLWVVVAGSALLLVFILIFFRRKDEDEDEDEEEGELDE